MDGIRKGSNQANEPEINGPQRNGPARTEYVCRTAESDPIGAAWTGRHPRDALGGRSMTPAQSYDAYGNSRPRRRGCMGCLSSVLFGFDLVVRLAVVAMVFVFFVLFIAMLVPEPTPKVEKGAALVVAPSGFLVEELSGGPLDRAVTGWLGQAPMETRLRDLLAVIDRAAGDDDIAAMVLDLDGFLGAGPSKLLSVGAALDRFRETGKPVIAKADFYTRPRYQLAAHADDVYLHDMGAVLLEGYSVYRTFMRDGLERLGVDWNVFRVGAYKSAVEPYLHDEMSAAAEEANLAWLGDLWGLYLDDVAAARGIDRDALESFARDAVTPLRAAGGNTAQAALDAGLVDLVGGRDLLRDKMIELVGSGTTESDEHTFKQIDHQAYLAARGDDRDHGGDAVAVVVARGTILPGEAPPGTIGAESTARLVRRARFDDRVKAVVLRVDSGGGSAFASEVVRRELELLREAGKPVVTSMSSVAASGGYWIAMASDEVWASPATLTGSIGIFAYFPTVDRPLEQHLGLRVDGVGTTPAAGRMRPDLPLPESVAETFQLSIDHGYEQFVTLVADARDMSYGDAEALAGGRVWSGVDAAEAGLVDRLGELDDAIASAATLANLEEGYAVTYVEQVPTAREQLLIDLLAKAERAPGLGKMIARELSATRKAEATLTRLLGEHAEMLAAAQAPGGLIAHCQCDVR